MPKTEMREVLDNVFFQDLSAEISKLSIPGSTHVQVVIETLNETFQKIENITQAIDYQFLENVVFFLE